MNFATKYTPSVERRWLYLIAACMWSAIGILLCFRAYEWLILEDMNRALWFSLAGMVTGVFIYRFKFSKIANKNIKRIAHLRERPCIFAFQSPASYALIVFMMGLGITLRHSSIPKLYLAVLYLGIGLGLFLSSLRYYRHAA